MINADNYELYFFRYAEGMLGEAERREIEVFAQQHPDLAEELRLYAEAPRINGEPLHFPDKEDLKHTATQPRMLWWKVAAVVVAIVVCGWVLFYKMISPQSLPIADQAVLMGDKLSLSTASQPCQSVGDKSLYAESKSPNRQKKSRMLADNNTVSHDKVLDPPQHIVESKLQDVSKANVTETMETIDEEEEYLLDPVTTMAFAQAILAEYSSAAENDKEPSGQTPAQEPYSIPQSPISNSQLKWPSNPVLVASIVGVTIDITNLYNVICDFKESHDGLMDFAAIFI